MANRAPAGRRRRPPVEVRARRAITVDGVSARAVCRRDAELGILG
ncbi:hypothetical protein [Streptomyces sp. Qhu_M48]